MFARALVDQMGGLDAGHRLVSLFDGEDGIAVDDTFALPGGPGAPRGCTPPRRRHLRLDSVASSTTWWWPTVGTPSSTRAVLSGSSCVLRHRDVALRRTPQSTSAAVDRAGASGMDGGCRVRRRCRRLPGRAVASIDRVVGHPQRTHDASSFVPARRPAGGPVSLLFVGHLSAGKRPQLFVQLLERMREAGRPVVGRMVGAGPMEIRIESC